MLKKRLIFTLLYSDGAFMLSRNFRLQRVGDINWLQKNYNFSKISFSIDELIVLNVSRYNSNTKEFCDTLKQLQNGCFVPIAAGGGIRSIEHAKMLLRSGADKVVVNTPLYEDHLLIEELAKEFGVQCVVASLDIIRNNNGYFIRTNNGSKELTEPADYWLKEINKLPIGEIYLNSIEKDGTGQGYDLGILSLLPKDFNKPVILAGGVGYASHLLQGLHRDEVDAVATAHLFNFVGDGLKQAREKLIYSGINLPQWDLTDLSFIH